MHLMFSSKLKALFLLPVLLILFSFGEGNKEIPKFPLAENNFTYSDIDLGSNLGNAVIDDSENTFYIDGKVIDPTVEERCEEDEFAAIYTCTDVTSKLNDFVPGPKCTPTTVNWKIKFRFPAEDVAAPVGTYRVVFFWDYDNSAAFTQKNAVWVGDGYEASDSHTYPQGTEEICTRSLVSNLFIVGVGACGNTNATALEEIVTWDDLSNTFLGIHDVSHEATSAGVEVGETVELCAGDDSAVRLEDTSTFNCQAGDEPNPANENRESRWTQWVYGTFSDITTGPAVNEKIIINGVSYTNADLPIYGTPTQQPNPPGSITVPNAETDDIQMPTSALVGERFEVTIRSFNICNPFSTNNDLNPPQGGANNVFEINGPGGTEQAGLNAITGGVNFYANDNPITRPFDIIIAPKPPVPTAGDKDYCYGTDLTAGGNPGFEITPGALSVATEWYEDNGGLVDFGNQIANSNGANSNELEAAEYTGAGVVGTGFSGTDVGTYYVWGRYSSNTGTQNCWSDPVRIQFDVREQMTQPGTITSPSGPFNFDICADAPNITFTAPDPTGTGTPGGAWVYEWSFAGGTLNDDLSFVGPTNGPSVDVDITSTTASGLRRVRVRKVYSNGDDNGSNCPSTRRTFDFNIDPVSVGGTLTATNTAICLGDPTGNITLSGNTGTITGWEVNFNGGGFIADGALGVVNPINPTPATAGTYEYRANVRSGVCSIVQSSTVTVTVNPVPPQPTISTSGSIVCVGTNVTLTSSNTNADSYQWYKDGVAVVGETNQSIVLNTVVESGSYTVEVIGVAPTNCTSVISDPETVRIEPLPTASNPIGGGAVCGGSPAPDIIWTLTGRPPFNITYTRTETVVGAAVVTTNIVNYTPPEAFPGPYTFTISAPNPPSVATEVYEYEITVLDDDVIAPNNLTCSGTSLGTIPATVSIGGTAPTFVTGPTLSPDIVCVDGGSTTDPTLLFRLDAANVSGVGFVLTYTIDGSANRTKIFDTDASGDPVAAVTFNDAELNTVAPSPHVINIVSILSPSFCLSTFNIPLNFTVRPLPVITTQPINEEICENGTVSFISAATGTNLSFQWQEDPDGAGALPFVDIVDGGVYSGALTNTLTLTNAPLAMDANDYRVIITGYNAPSVLPLCPITSNEVTLTVRDFAVVTVQPTDAEICENTSINFSVTATGTGITYVWQEDNGGGFADLADGTVGGVIYANTTTNTISISNVTNALNGYDYRVKMTTTGSCENFSNPADLIVNPLPDANNLSPDLCEDQPLGSNTVAGHDLTIAAYSDVITGIAGSVGRTIEYYTDAGRTSGVSDPTNVDISNGLIIYTRVIDTAIGATLCSSDETINFTVNALPVAADPTLASRTFCESVQGGPLERTGVNLDTYNPQINGTATITWYPTLADAQALTNQIPAGAAAGEVGNYEVFDGVPVTARVVDGNTCVNYREVFFVVNPLPAANPILGADTQCVGGPTSLYQISPGSAGTTYNWNIHGDFIVFGGGTVNDFFVLLQFGTATVQTLEVTEISPENCAGDVQQLVITVQGSPPISAITGPSEVCENEAGVAFSVTNTANTDYAWTVPTGAAIINGQGTSAIVVNFGTTGGNVEVIPTSQGGGCTGGTATQAVTVNALPILDPALNNTVCSDEDIGITLVAAGASPVPATSYDVTANVSPGLLANTGPTTGNGILSAAIFNDNYTNTTGGALTVTYIVTPISADNCSGPTVNVIATINPEPVMGSGLDVTVCSDIAIGLTLNTAAGSVVASTYDIINVIIPGGITADGLNVTVPQAGVTAAYLANDKYENLGNAPLVVQYIVVPRSINNCPGNQLTINATINPKPVISTLLDNTVCSDAAIGVTLNTNGVSVAATTYNLVNVAVPGGLTAAVGNAAFPTTGVADNFIVLDSYTNQTNFPLNVTYTVQGESAANCTGDNRNIVITIDPEPVIDNTLSTAVCSDVASGITFAFLGTAVAANDYNLIDVVIPMGATPAVTNAAFPASNQADNYIAADSYTNQTAAAIDVVYEVRGVSAGPANCEGDSEFITLTVNPEPVIDPALDATVCSDAAVGINFATDGISVGAASYDFVNKVVQAGLVDVGNVPVANGVLATYIATDSYTNTGNSSLTVTYEVRGTAAGTGCVGKSEFIVVTIDPEPVVSTGLNTTICSDISIGVTLATNGTSIAAANYNLINVTIPAGLTPNAGNASFPQNGVVSGYITNDTYTNITANPLNAIYEVKGVSGANCIGDSELITVIINPEPVVNTSLDAPACSDVAIGVTLSIEGAGVAAANYNYINVTIPGGLTAGGNAVIPSNGQADNYINGDTYTNQTLNPLDVVYEVKGVSGIGCIGDSEFITVTINPEPVVSSTLNATVCSNLAIGLTLASDGASEPAVSYNVLTVSTQAGIIADGGNVIIPSNAVPAGYVSGDIYNNPTSGLLTVTYEVQGISVAGCVGDSRSIIITIDPEPVIDPNLDVTVCSDDATGVSFSTIGTSVAANNYNVKAVTIPGGVTAAVGNATIPGVAVGTAYIFNDSYTNQTANPLDVIYEVTATSAAPCEGQSEFITVTVNPEPVISSTLDTTVCSDAIVGVILNTDGISVGATLYNIISINAAVGLVAGGGNVGVSNGELSDYIQNDRYTNKTFGPLDVIYEVRGVSAANCVGDSEFIIITINPEPIVNTGLNTTVCSDDAVGVTLVTEGGSVGAIDYNLIAVTVPAGLAADAGNAVVANGVAANYIVADSYTNVTGGAINVTYEIQARSGANCTGDSEFIIIAINPEPVIDPTLDATVCSDIPIGINFGTDVGSVAAANYNLINVTVPATLTAGVGNVVPANGIGATYIANDVYTNTTNGSLDVTYEVVGVSGSTCAGDSEIITITINPEPVMNPGLDVTVCSDLVIGVNLSGDGISINPTLFNIINVTIPGSLAANVANAPIPANNQVANYISGDIYTNTTSTPLDVIYEVRGVSGASCIGDSEFITVTINPEPVINSGLNTAVCSDNAIGVNFSTSGTSVAAANYDLIAVTIPGSLTAAGTNVAFPANAVVAGYIAGDTYTNVTAGALDVTYEIRGRSADGCLGDNVIITIIINPEPVIDPTLNISVCSDLGIGLVLNTNGSSIGAANYNIIDVAIPAGLIANAGNAVFPANNVASAYLSTDRYINATTGPLDVIYEVKGVSFSACIGDSELITVTIEPGPVLDPNMDDTVCSDTAIGVNFAINVGSVAATSYNIVGITPNPSLTPGVTNVVISNGEAANYIAADTYTNTTSIPLDVIYEVQGVSAATCVGPSEFITVTIDPEPVIDNGLNKSVCSDEAVGLILVTNGVSVGALVYNIISVTIDSGLTAAAGNAPIPANNQDDDYLSNDSYTNTTGAALTVVYEARAESGSTCEGDSKLITITVDPEPIVDANLNTDACSDNPVGVTLGTAVGSAAANYNIVAVTVPGTISAAPANAVIPANGVAPGYFSGDTYTNQTANPVNVIYDVQAVSTLNCVGDIRSITVTINPEPVIDPAITATVCSDLNIGVNIGVVAGSTAAASYDYLDIVLAAGLTPNVGNAIIPTLAQSAGYINGDIYTNVTATPLDVVYEIKANSGLTCQGDSEFITVTINPEPVLNPGLNATICSTFDVAGIIFSTNGVSTAATSYNLISVTPDISLVAGGANAFPANGVADTHVQNDTYENTTNGDLTVDYVVAPVSSQGCIGDQVIITLTVRPQPVLNATVGAPLCSDVPIGHTLAVVGTSIGATVYNIVSINWDPLMSPGGANAGIGNAQAANAIAADTYTNTTMGVRQATYDIEPVSADGCKGAVQQLTFNINPAPALAITLDKIVCDDDVIGLILGSANSVPASTYDITVSIPAGITAAGGNAVLPAFAQAANYLSNDTFSNGTDNPLVVEYTVVPISAASCKGPPTVVSITVEPDFTATATNTKTIICSNDNVSITLGSLSTPSAGSVTFNVTAVTSNPGTVSGFIPSLNFLPIGHEIVDFLVNSGNTQETVTYTITPVASGAAGGGGCLGDDITEVVTIDPLPQVTSGQFKQVCSGVSLGYSITTTPNLPGTTFTWPAPTLPAGVTGGSARGALPASGLPIDDTFVIDNNIVTTRQIIVYEVTPFGPSGCQGNTVNVQIFVDPTPDGTISIDQPIVCSGGSALLRFDMTVGTAPFTIVYNDGSGDITIPNIANSHFIALNNLTTTTTYTFVSITDVNGCELTPVGNQVTVTVENPISSFTIVNDNGCTPLEVVFNNNNIQAGTEYTWNFGDGSAEVTTNAATVNYTYINNSTFSDISFSPTLTAKITNGSVVCTQITSGFVTIRAGVALNVTPSVTDGCSPLTINFSNNSQGVLSSKWFWRAQGTAVENDIQTSFPVSYTLSNTTTSNIIYEVVYQGTRNTCSDEVITEITVYPEVVADFTVAPGTTVSINDPEITVTNTTLNGSSWITLWEWGDGQSTTNIDPGSHTYAAFGIYELKLTVRDPSGVCESVKIVPITVEPTVPIVDFEVDITEGCMPLTVQFTNLSTSVDPNTYVWTFVDETGTTIGVSTAENPEFTFFAPGIINVTLEGSNPLGIKDTETKLGYIEIYDIPTASLSVRPEVVFLPDQLMFTSNLSRLADEFQWDFDGDGIFDSDEFEPSFQYTDPGVYDVTLIAINSATGCRDTTILEQAVTVVESGSSEIPNGFFPGSGIGGDGTIGGGGAGGSNTVFLPRIKGVRDDGFMMQVFDRWGHLLFESNDKTVGWNGRNFNTGKLMAMGVYVYKLELVYLSGEQTTIVGDINLIR